MTNMYWIVNNHCLKVCIFKLVFDKINDNYIDEKYKLNFFDNYFSRIIYYRVYEKLEKIKD
jgi:hypothetical protein